MERDGRDLEPQEPTDAELLQAFAASRSDTAFASISRRHIDMVYAAALRILNDPHAAEDAVQATFLVLVQRAPSLSPRTSLSGWLYTTAVLSARNLLRARRRQHLHENAAREQTDMVAMLEERDHPTDTDLAPLLDTAMETLPAPQREAIVLRYFRRLSTEQAAREMNCPEPTFLSRLQSGLSRLRDRLKRAGVVVPLAMLGTMLQQASAAEAPTHLLQTVNALSHGTAASSTTTQLAETLGQQLAQQKTLGILAWSACALLTLTAASVAVLNFASTASPVQAMASPAPLQTPPAQPEPAIATTLDGLRLNDASIWETMGELPARIEAETAHVRLAKNAEITDGRTFAFFGLVHKKQWVPSPRGTSLKFSFDIPANPHTSFSIRAVVKPTGSAEKKTFLLVYDGDAIVIRLSQQFRQFVPGTIVTYTMNGGNAVPLLGSFPKLAPGRHTMELLWTPTHLKSFADGKPVYEGAHNLSIESVQFGLMAAVHAGSTSLDSVELKDVVIGDADASREDF